MSPDSPGSLLAPAPSITDLAPGRLDPGNQRPRIENTPPAWGTFGPRVSTFAAACGVVLDDWQNYVINGLFAVDELGQWVASEFGLLVSRQNGKGEILVAYDLAHLFMFPRADNRRKTLLHTAHEVKTAIDGFQRLTGVIESKGKLMDRVEPRGIRIGNGQEGITLKKRAGQLNGDRARFIARTKSSGRGFSGDTNVYDEAQELSSSKRDALTYTQTQAPNRQEVFTGTVPSDENDFEVFKGVRDRGRSGSGKRTGWMEWTPVGSENPKALLQHPNVPIIDLKPDAVIIDLASHDVWRDSNPAVNLRAFNFEVIAENVERATDIEALARERFSFWPNDAENVEIAANELDLDAWDHAGSTIEPDGSSLYRVTRPEAISIAFGRGGAFATVAKGQRFDAEFIAVEHAKTAKGTLWVPKFIGDLKTEFPEALVVLDPKNAGSILLSLEALKVKAMSMNYTELAAAYADFIELVNAGLIVHPAQPEVTKSLKSAVPRAIGTTGFTWDVGDAAKPVTHTQAVTWAVWGVKKLEAAPPKEPGNITGFA